MTEQQNTFRNLLNYPQNNFQKDFLLFKNDILKDIKLIENKLNSKFDKNLSSVEIKLDDYKNKTISLNQKVNDLSSLIIINKNMEEKMNLLLQFKNNTKDEFINQKVKIESKYKELHDLIFGHGKLLSESIIYPGIIGGMSKFKNFHGFIDYVLLNIKELVNEKEKNVINLKSYKEQLESTMQNVKLQIDSLTKSIYDYTKNCIVQSEIKLTDMMKLYDNKIQDINLENNNNRIALKNSIENLTHEMEKENKIKEEMYEKINLEIEKIKQTNCGVAIKFEYYEKEFDQIKSNLSQLNVNIKDIKSKLNGLIEKKLDKNLNPNSKSNNNKSNSKITTKKIENFQNQKNGKNIDNNLKKNINGVIGTDGGVDENINNENGKHLSNIQEIEGSHLFKSNENHNLMKLTYNNSFNNFLNRKNFKNSNFNSLFFMNNGNNNNENDNIDELNEFSRKNFYQKIKIVNSQSKSFSEIPTKNHKVNSEIFLESKNQNNNEIKSENNIDEEPKKINSIKYRFNDSMSIEDIKKIERSYSIFPKLLKRNCQKDIYKIQRAHSEEEEDNKNRFALSCKNYHSKNNNTFRTPKINLKKIPVSNLNADMFKSIDGENSYFNKNNSYVSFIGNSIQVIHSKKNEDYIKNNKKKKDSLNLSNPLNEIENKEEDNFLNRKIIEKKYYKKKKNNSQEKINNYYNIKVNDNCELRYSKLSKIINNFSKNIPKKNLLLNDKYN